jgi:RNA-directed DNA polymerase
MNQGDDCRCIRYIDDFIILGPTEKAVNSRLRRAKSLLSRLDMELAPEKSSSGAREIEAGLSFLGIDIKPGIIRPSERARKKLLKSIEDDFNATKNSFQGLLHGKDLDSKNSLISTLKRVQGRIDGWGKHYWFCNDELVWRRLDQHVNDLTKDFLGFYADIRARLPEENKRSLLGIPSLTNQKREPFRYPKRSSDRFLATQSASLAFYGMVARKIFWSMSCGDMVPT